MGLFSTYFFLVLDTNDSIYIGGQLTACYNVGRITISGGTDTTYFGGVVGSEYTSAGTISANYWLDIIGDAAEYGIGNTIPNTSAALPFSAADWPTTITTDPQWHPQWGKGNGSGDGQYWKDLGGWDTGENHVFPKLWFEKN